MQSPHYRLQITSLLLILFLFATAHAQTFRGGINGSILDPAGVAIANASIIATNTATGAHTNGISTSSGEFLFPDLPLGEYNLTIKLAIGATAETITVSANILTLNTTTTTQTTVLDAHAVAGIPLNGRD